MSTQNICRDTCPQISTLFALSELCKRLPIECKCMQLCGAGTIYFPMGSLETHGLQQACTKGAHNIVLQ